MNDLPRTRTQRRRLFLLVFPILAASALAGCGRGPQVSDANREIVVSLATAVSTRESKWLDSNAELIEKHRAEGTCSDAEYSIFQDIIAKARAGDWDAAEAAAYALRDAQQPTAEDLKHLNERKLSGDHGLTRPRAGWARKS